MQIFGKKHDEVNISWSVEEFNAGVTLGWTIASHPGGSRNTLWHFKNSPLTLSVPRTYLQILLCLTQDDFTLQRETPWH